MNRRLFLKAILAALAAPAVMAAPSLSTTEGEFVLSEEFLRNFARAVFEQALIESDYAGSVRLRLPKRMVV